MKTGRPSPILPEQPAGGSREREQPTGNQPVNTTMREAAAYRNGSRGSFAGAIKQLFRDLKHALTAKTPAPQPTPRRRRSGEDSTGGFRLFARAGLRRTITQPDKTRQARAASFAFFDHATPPKKEPLLLAAHVLNDGPMSPGELITWYRANGFSIEAIRAMFPAFFQQAAEPEPHCNALDCLNPYWTPAFDETFDDCNPTGQNNLSIHL